MFPLSLTKDQLPKFPKPGTDTCRLDAVKNARTSSDCQAPLRRGNASSPQATLSTRADTFGVVGTTYHNEESATKVEIPYTELSALLSRGDQ
jgi:hypothetical protein